MSEHKLTANPTHSRWNRDLAPRLTIASGDTVHFECEDSSGAQVTPQTTVETFQQIDRGKIHALTGPVAVHNAQPGDTLQIDVLGVDHLGWGWSSIIPGLGFLKERFASPFFFPWALDKDTTSSLAPAIVPLQPFCGIMGVAPDEPGELRTRPPGVFGGNMDVRELSTGATLYLPVQVAGALFSCGDAHAAQGDGEVCINALETCLTGTFTLILHRGADGAEPLRYPRAETPTHFISMGMNSDLDQAMKQALREMIRFICARTNLSRQEAYQLCSLAVDFRVTQTVNGEKGVHGMLKRGLLF